MLLHLQGCDDLLVPANVFTTVINISQQTGTLSISILHIYWLATFVMPRYKYNCVIQGSEGLAPHLNPAAWEDVLSLHQDCYLCDFS